jgi:hypothetical protein
MSRRRGQNDFFNSPLALGWSRNPEALRAPSEPWPTLQTERLHI